MDAMEEFKPLLHAIRTVQDWLENDSAHVPGWILSFGVAAVYLAAMIACSKKLLPTRLLLPC